MSTVAAPTPCFHPSLIRGPQAAQCPDCFGLYKGDKRLVSVSRIIGVWPQEPCSSCHWPIYSDHQAGCSVKANIDNARERGRQVDSLFSAYVIGKLDKIPAGTRKDVYDVEGNGLLQKLMTWFDKQRFADVESQVVVADDECGGVLDLRLDGMIVDLKATSKISPTHAIQVGGYVSLDVFASRKWPKGAAILHVTERLATPKLIPLKMDEVAGDFETCRDLYRVVQRRTA